MSKYLKNRFDELKDQFDLEVPDRGHFDRFQARLESKSKFNFWKPLAIAASLLLLLSLSGPFFSSNTLELKDVSPKMEETQAYFTSVIDKELRELGKLETSANKKIISDALSQFEVLETEYKNLMVQLLESNEDKIIIYAMINNYQKRIDILRSVINQINNLNESKYNTNENNLI